MKNLFPGILICMVLFSCKKEPKDLFSPSEVAKVQKYGISFNLKDFTPEVLGVKSKQMSEVPLEDKVEYLCYIAYNEEGKEVSRIRQYAEGPFPFGTFTDSLASGNYTIVIIASKARFGINSRNEGEYQPVLDFDAAFFEYEYVQMENRSIADDTFYKKFQLKVEAKDSIQPVELERIVAKVEINILDAKPDLRYEFQFINEYLGMRFADNTYVEKSEDQYFNGAKVTRENTRFTSFILNTDPSIPIDIVIEAYQRPSSVPMATKTIAHVPFFKNKVTVLTGNMHSTNTAAGFSVKVNDEFDKDTVNVSF